MHKYEDTFKKEHQTIQITPWKLRLDQLQERNMKGTLDFSVHMQQAGNFI